jgi:four helix bundle protein
MSLKSYRELLVWQKSILATKMVYLLVKRLPREELFALSSQMRRAAISIPSNIAEGQARNSAKEFLKFLSIAKGSKAELETQLTLCVEIKYLTQEDISSVMSLLEEIGKMLNSLICKLSNNILITNH